jgi:WD40 repeat protein
LAFSSDGQILASSSRDNTVRLWDIATRQPLHQPFIGHTNYVFSVAFSADDRVLASGSRDGEIRLWDVATGQTLGQPLTAQGDWIKAVAFSPDGNTLVSGSRNYSIWLWNVNREQWQEQACRVANRNLSETEWQRYFSTQPFRPTCDAGDAMTTG